MSCGHCPGVFWTAVEASAIGNLISMGFSRDASIRALLDADWCVAAAVDALVGAQVEPPSTPRTGPDGEPTEAPRDDDAVGPSPSPAASSGPGRDHSRNGQVCARPGCSRIRNRTTIYCCSRCPTGHTRTCCGNNRSSAGPSAYVQADSPEPAINGHAQSSHPAPAPPVPPPRVLCPICLEQFDVDGMIHLHCRHQLCRQCRAAMHAAGLDSCPLCRAPMDNADANATSRPADADNVTRHEANMYLLLIAPASQQHLIGLHVVSWRELEARLGCFPGSLAGTLHRRGLQIRRLSNIDEALVWWRFFGRSGSPVRHDADR